MLHICEKKKAKLKIYETMNLNLNQRADSD